MKKRSSLPAVEKIYPQKIRFLFAWMIYSYLIFIPFIPVLWFLERESPTFSYLWEYPLVMLFISIPGYIDFTLSIDDEKVEGPAQWGWLRRKEQIRLSDIDPKKVSRQSLGRLLGITIIHSADRKKILTLGLSDDQILHILKSIKSDNRTNRL
jgi:hypothetical protein